MIEELAKQASDSLWRKIGEKALTTAVTEVIKASIDLAKRAKLREQKAAFDDRRKQQKKNEADEADEPEQSEADEELDEDEDEAEASKPKEPPAEDACVDFAAYVASRRGAAS
jgi:hypothetical protein